MPTWEFHRRHHRADTDHARLIIDASTPRGGCLFGGGFVAWQGATLTIVHSEVEANTCRYGGGIQVALASTLVVRESKLTRNYAEWDGGAIGLGSKSKKARRLPSS